MFSFGVLLGCGKCGARSVWGPIEVACRFARTGEGAAPRGTAGEAVETLCGENQRPSPSVGSTFF